MHYVVKKLPDVSNLLIEHDVKIAGITESWALSNINNAQTSD